MSDKEEMKKMIREEMQREREANQRPQRKFHFMSGMPRSGSTLLAAILNQNPRFHAGASSPVVSMMNSMEQTLMGDELYNANPKPQQASMIMANLLPMFYTDVSAPVVFDMNRSWVARIGWIKNYFGIEQPKIIVPVRDMEEVLASFIAMLRRNPTIAENGTMNFIDRIMTQRGIPLTDDNRCAWLAGPEGVVGLSFDAIRRALMEGNQKCLHFVEYNDLINNTQETMRGIYEFLEEEYFEHNFADIQSKPHEGDLQVYGLADMHEVRSQISKSDIDPTQILSEEVLQACQGTDIWRQLELMEEDEEVYDANVIEQEASNETGTQIIGA